MSRVAVIGLYGMSALFSAEHLPGVGETIGSNGLIFEPGGKGYNQALGALRAGADVFYATAVGEDAYGEGAQRVFEADGLKHYHCLKVPGASTAFAAVVADKKGRNMVIVEQGACGQITPAMVDALEEELAGCSILLLQCEMPREAVAHALALGNRYGLYTILNPAPARPLSREELAMCDLVTPNFGEAAALAGLPKERGPQEIAEAICTMGAKNVIITLGAQGSFIMQAGKPGVFQPSFDVPVIDTTGAGDNFNGALAAQLSRGASLLESARYASASSSLSVARRGVLAAIPTGAEIEAFLANKQ